MEDCTRIVGLLYSSIQFDCDRILWIVRFCKSLLIVARFSWSWCKIQITIVTNKTTHENWHCLPTWRTQYKHNQFLSILLQSKNADTIRKDCGKTVWIAKWFIVKKKIFWLAILLLKKTVTRRLQMIYQLSDDQYNFAKLLLCTSKDFV